MEAKKVVAVSSRQSEPDSAPVSVRKAPAPAPQHWVEREREILVRAAHDCSMFRRGGEREKERVENRRVIHQLSDLLEKDADTV